MKKKIALTVVLGLFVGFGIFFVVELMPNYIEDIKWVVKIKSDESIGSVMLSDDWLWYLIKQGLKIIFVIIANLLAIISILKVWKKEIQHVSFSFEEYKHQKEKKKEEKRQNKLNKLEEKIKKYKN